MERRTELSDHPEYYEAIFGGAETDQQWDFLESLSHWFGTGGKKWLEPACGAGRLVEAAASRGHQVVGYDLSEAMLEHARARLTPAQRRRVRLFPSRMETFDLPEEQGTFDLAHCLVSTFRYLGDEAQARAHLEHTHRLLKPGGIYVLGFHLTDYSRREPEHERWVGQVGRDRVVCNTREWPPQRRERYSRMRNRLRVTGPGKDWMIETEWRFRTYDQSQALELIQTCGFELVGLYDFDHDVERPQNLWTDRLDWVLVLRPQS